MASLNSMLKAAGNKYASKVSEGNLADVDTYIDPGSLALNALASGSVYGGIPSNKTSIFAGESTTGKTFFALNVIRKFLEDNENGFVFYFDSESSVTTEMLTSRGIDIERIAILPVVTVQEFRSQVVRMLDQYILDVEADPENRKPILFVLDSLGALSTTKEITDIAEGNETRDMTRSQLIRGMFRVLDLKLGVAKVPLIITNHTYAVIGSYVPTRVQSGGEGGVYGADNIIFLKKSKDKDKETKEVTGVLITCTNQKSRLTIENREVQVVLDYQNGLQRFSGLLDLAIKYGLVKQDGKHQLVVPTGVKTFKKDLEAEPEKFFDNKEFLDAIDAACKVEFTYGASKEA
jgi:RecA/RadA recombinase